MHANAILVDMQHLRVVKPDKHTQFAGENDMISFFVSAKSGDNVISSFTRIAADLSGVSLSKSDVEVATVCSGVVRKFTFL